MQKHQPTVHGMKDEDEDNTAMALRGATYEEAFELVQDIDVDNMNLVEIVDMVDPILKKYGWTFRKLLEETIKRKDVS